MTINISQLDTNLAHKQLLIKFFEAFNNFMGCEMGKKKYNLLKFEFDLIYELISNTRDHLEANTDKRNKIDGLVLEMIWGIAEIRKHMPANSLDGLMMLQYAEKKFKTYANNVKDGDE